MTLDEYEHMPNAMRLQVAMALIQAAQEHVGHEDCDTDIGLAGVAAYILEEYCERRDSGRGLDLEVMGEEASKVEYALSKIDLVRRH